MNRKNEVRYQYNDPRYNDPRYNDPRYQNPYRKPKKKKRGSVLVWIQLVLSLVVETTLVIADALPLNYLIISGLVLLLLFLFPLGLVQSHRSRRVGQFVSGLLCLILIAAGYYLIRTTSVLDQITGANTRTDTYSVIVLASDEAEDLQDVAGDTYLTVSSDAENTARCLEKIQSATGTEVVHDETTNYTDCASELLVGYYRVILFNEAYRDMVEESYPSFSDDTKVIYTITLKTKLSSASDVDVTKECYTVFISGIDVYGDISQTSRSDTNIIATVNPNTHQILLVSTPRDAYLPLAMNGEYDKLTHAGLYGIEESMHTLENLYGISLDYYARVNFSGFEEIVDALGGITLENDYTFTSVDGYYYEAGTIDLDGEEALNFARERKAFAEGDIQRGRNQMKVIKAIINKATSPAIITGYDQILSSLDGSFETSMGSKAISAICKEQISDGSSWNVTSYAVLGYGDQRYTYSIPSKAVDVVILDESTVAEAKSLMQAVRNGETLD